MKWVFLRRDISGPLLTMLLKSIYMLFTWVFTNVSYLFLPAYFPWSQVRQISRRRSWQMWLGLTVYLVPGPAGRYKNILIWLPASRCDHLPPLLLLLLPQIPHGDSWHHLMLLLCSNCFVCYKLELLLILLTATVGLKIKKNNQPVSIMMSREDTYMVDIQ